jgi:beta-N-acetylhexosaminidase
VVRSASTVVLAALESTSISSEEAAFFHAHPVSGVTLFARNIPENYSDLTTLTNNLQRLRSGGDPNLIIAIDQEGGRVRRIKDSAFPNDGPALQLAAGIHDSQALQEITEYGHKVGSALLTLGVNVNFAPVLDIITRPDNEAIGDRSFGTNPTAVLLRAGAFFRGLEALGVRGCFKHFPGQGDAPADTHVASAVIQQPRKLLMTRELLPFRELVPTASMVMMSHCIYPALDDRPAGMSPVVIETLLRRELGFDGVVVSDDLLMEAVPQAEERWQAALIESILAGVDLLLVCKGLRRIELAVKTLAAEAQKSKAFAQRLEQAAQRVLRLRSKLL